MHDEDMAGVHEELESAPKANETSQGPLIAILLDHIESDYHVEIIESAIRVAERRGARTLIDRRASCRERV